jgi:predicted NBD/HSP70 family sugar kinase
VPRSSLASAPPPRGPVEILLARASVAALVRHLTHRGQAIPTIDDLDAAIAACPEGLDEWLDDCVEALVGPVLSAQALLDVPDIVVDGDLGAEVVATVLARLGPALAAAMPEARQPPRLSQGSFGSDAHAMGAASLPLFIDFAPRAGIAANARALSLKGADDAPRA